MKAPDLDRLVMLSGNRNQIEQHLSHERYGMVARAGVNRRPGITDSDTTAAAVAKIRAVLPGEEHHDLEPRLAPLVGADPGVTRIRFESFAAWRRFIQIIADRAPTVLAVEDLHWAAPMLLDFLEDLMAGLSDVPVLVVAIARPELLDARPGWGAGASSIRLSPLPARDVAA